MILPSTVRLATPADEPAILFLLEQMHAENGLFRFSKDRTRDLVRLMLLAPNNANNPLPPSMVGVIGSNTDMQGTIGLMLNRLYYTDDWHLADLWNFVRPDCRQSKHAKELLKFGKRSAGALNVQLMSGVVSKKDTERKVKLYRRLFGEPVGGFFLHNGLTPVADQSFPATDNLFRG